MATNEVERVGIAVEKENERMRERGKEKVEWREERQKGRGGYREKKREKGREEGKQGRRKKRLEGIEGCQHSGHLAIVSKFPFEPCFLPERKEG